MVWTEITRGEYRRDHLRYASDTTDAEWSLLAPLLSERSRTVDLRAVVNAILYTGPGAVAQAVDLRAPGAAPTRLTHRHRAGQWRMHQS
jgi:transposase